MANELSGVVSLNLDKSPEPHPQAGTIEAVAKRFEVNSEAAYTEATALIQNSAAIIARVEGFFETDKNLAHRLHASICEKIRSITAPWRAVRPIIEPKMRRFRADQAEAKRLADLKIQRENEAKEHAAREVAAKIQREADAEAARLRDVGQMRLAKETQQQGTAKAVEVVFAAAQLAEIGTVLPDVRPAGGPGESRPWQAEVTDLKAMCAAIGRGEIPLTYEMPKRGGGSEMVPLVEPNMALLNYLAKRMGRADIGIAGARGIRELSLKFSRSAPVPVQSGIVKDGWD